MLAGASGFLGFSVFSWVRSAIYNQLYYSIVLPTKNSVPERAGEGSARESTRTHVGKAQADAAEPKIIAAEAHDPCGTTRGARSAPAEANLATKSLGRSSPDPDRPATNQAASSRRATRGERSAPGAIPARLRRRSLQNASDKGRDLRQRFSTPNARRRDRSCWSRAASLQGRVAMHCAWSGLCRWACAAPCCTPHCAGSRQFFAVKPWQSLRCQRHERRLALDDLV